MVNTHDRTSVLLLLLGGVMLLLYGVRLITDAMERALGARLRLAMMTLAQRPFAAFATGVVATVLTVLLLLPVCSSDWQCPVGAPGARAAIMQRRKS